MKSSKEISKPKKISRVNKPSENNKNKFVRSFTHDEISEKANEIYLQRIERGESGTPENDWIEAEKYLSESADQQ
jgi:hypothetical protein